METFHPVVRGWFEDTFENPSEIQKAAWPAIQDHKNTLISAPTGSGKTFAAFLSDINELVEMEAEGRLPDRVHTLYVSPLKALSNDIHRNLQAPMDGIRQRLEAAEGRQTRIRVMVRTGDTPVREREAMKKNPPHILVTTPESLYLLLTSNSGREMLRDVKTLIVDEIHAVIGSKRGAHLALSMERLEELTDGRLIRIGISATQNPIEKVAAFLTGSGRRDCTIVNMGHMRDLDVNMVLPESPLSAVMSHEVWGEIYGQLESLILKHKTTLIFVNTRATAERLAHQLADRVGNGVVTAHHGSMSKEHRFEAEQRLKDGELKALIATASMELGIDIGSVDLVCQLGSPKAISAFLQRVGRSGHTLKGIPKGRIFPLSRDDLIECAALLGAIGRGELDQIIIPEKPLDVLCQQIIAETAQNEYVEDHLFSVIKRAYPYRHLTRKEFDDVVVMLSEGFSNRRGRKRAYIKRDLVNGTVKGRKGAQINALMCGGTIPDHFDYDVILEPTGTFIGQLNEDFAIESTQGDIVQLGNNSWRILKVERGKIRVEDAHGMPATMPFWFGEAPARTFELSEAISTLREQVSEKIGSTDHIDTASARMGAEMWGKSAIDWITTEIGISRMAAGQIVEYIGATKAALGVVPSQDNIVMERFFDDAGDMHLVIHSVFGSRINRAWGLALRKRFCRNFNFELQAAANEDSIILSLGATHSFPLEEVFRYLKHQSVRDILIQALFDAPMFEARWRWNASIALAILRRRGGERMPPQIQRSQAEDLIAQVFPDQLACLENIKGDREIPDHPLVAQTIDDCLNEAMDIGGLETLLERMQRGELNLVARDLREPSAMSQEILNARPYAFLDDAPLEERRTNAVRNRRWMDPAAARELGHLDTVAIAAVCEESRPQVDNKEDLHDALILCGYLIREECRDWMDYYIELEQDGRAYSLDVGAKDVILVAIEKTPLFGHVFENPVFSPFLELDEEVMQRLAAIDIATDRRTALTEIVRSRLETLGPVSASRFVRELNVPVAWVNQALIDLEQEGFAFRGYFNPNAAEEEWCERRLLARIHRYTLSKLRREIEPVSAADFMRFLFEWQHVGGDHKLEGPEAVGLVLEQLEGIEASATTWEGDILPGRIKDYDYIWLDALCLSGRMMWGRLRPYHGSSTPSRSASPIRTTPIMLIGRRQLALWQALRAPQEDHKQISGYAKQVLQVLQESGASFYHEIVQKVRMLGTQTEQAIGELVAEGLITSDSFTGLRALLVPGKYRERNRRRRQTAVFDIEMAGRWSIIEVDHREADQDNNIEDYVRIALRRYGVVLRKIVDNEPLAPPWRELVKVMRRMEARGEVRGGRFVAGMWGEQYALPEAVAKLRQVRRTDKTEEMVCISASDPLNLTGIVTPGPRVAGLVNNRILFRDGDPIVVREGKKIRFIKEPDEADRWAIQKAVEQREIPPKLKPYIGKGIT
jgi:ATP-dependent Lhr-like helicase